MQLEVQPRDHLAQVGVAAALPVAVDGALDLGSPRQHRFQGAGSGQPRVVVAVDGHRRIQRRHHLGGHLADPPGQSASVGVAQYHPAGPCPAGRLEGSHGVVRVLAVAVEEVLPVEEHLQALIPQKGHRFLDDAQVFLGRAAQHLFYMEQGRLAEQGNHPRSRLGQRL